MRVGNDTFLLVYRRLAARFVAGRTVVLWICKTWRLKTTDYNTCCSGKRSHHALLASFPGPCPASRCLQQAYCKRRKAGERTTSDGKLGKGLGTANTLRVFCTQIAPPTELAKSPLPQAR